MEDPTVIIIRFFSCPEYWSLPTILLKYMRKRHLVFTNKQKVAAPVPYLLQPEN
jgi:hypothetical protein